MTFQPLIPACLITLIMISGCKQDKDALPKSAHNTTPVKETEAQLANQSVTRALFSPAESIIALNSDILFADAATTDGTAKTPDTQPPVTSAINDLDGFSTTAPFDIPFSAPLLDESIVDITDTGGTPTTTQNVFVLALNIDGDALDISQLDLDNPFGALQPSFRADVVTLGSAQATLRISPLTPLQPKTKYLIFLTNSIKDHAGDPVAASLSYDFFGDKTQAQNPISPTVGIQVAVQGWEDLAVGYLQNLHIGTDADTLRDSIVYSNTFTTTATTDVLTAMAAPKAALLAAQPDTDPAAVNALEENGFLPTPKARNVSFQDINPDDANSTGLDLQTLIPTLSENVGTYYQGSIELPYYLTPPAENGDGTEITTKFWQPDSTLASQLGVTLPADATEDTNGLSSESYNVTYRYPYASQVDLQKVPVGLVLPDNAGASPYPVAIFMHGIFHDRTGLLPLAYTLATQGIATIAIDLPLHGIPATSSFSSLLNVDRGLVASQTDAHERHFEFTQNPDTGAPMPMNFDSPVELQDISGALFINLTNLLTTRDNLRQGVMDLLNLNASLVNIKVDADNDGTAESLLDVNQVYFVGHSLGGIVGSVFTAINNRAVVQAFNPNLPFISAAALITTSGMPARILENSPAFSPTILGALAGAGVEQGSHAFAKYMYVYQAALDSTDPINMMQLFVKDTQAQQTGLLFMEVVGNGADQLPDQTIPNDGANPLNSAIASPLMGTEPLIKEAGAEADTNPGLIGDNTNPLKLAVRFTAGHHNSLIYPAMSGPDATATSLETSVQAEMHAEIASFFAAGGKQITLGSVNSSIIQ